MLKNSKKESLNDVKREAEALTLKRLEEDGFEFAKKEEPEEKLDPLAKARAAKAAKAEAKAEEDANEENK